MDEQRWMREKALYDRVAAEQHGQFHLSEWLEAELSRRRLEHLLRRGQLRRVIHKVYALPGTADTFESGIVAGCLRASRTRSGSNGAVAAGYAGSAAARWNLMPAHQPIQIATTRRVASVEGFRFHQVALPSEHVTILGGTPVTDVPRTLLDSCGEMYWQKALRLVSRALRNGLTSLDELAERCEAEARSGRNGVQVMRGILERLDPSVEQSRSDLEDEFYDLVKSLGLKLPERNYLIDCGRGFPWQVDFCWPSDMVVGEMDVYGTHSDFDVFYKDRDKFLDLGELGYTIIIVTDKMLRQDRGRLEARLASLLG